MAHLAYIQSIMTRSQHYKYRDTLTVLHSKYCDTFRVLWHIHKITFKALRHIYSIALRAWNETPTYAAASILGATMENTQTISQLFWSDNMHCYRFIAMNPSLRPLIIGPISLLHDLIYILYAPISYSGHAMQNFLEIQKNNMWRHICLLLHMIIGPESDHCTWPTNWLPYSRFDWRDSDDVGSSLVALLNSMPKDGLMRGMKEGF